MISKVTLKRISWTINTLAMLKATSFVYNYKTDCLELKSESYNSKSTNRYLYKLGKAFRIFNTVFPVIGSVFILLNLKLRTNVDLPDIVIGFYYACFWLLSIPVHVLILVWDDKFVRFVNSLLRFNLKLGK